MEQACVLYEMRFVALGFFACVGEKCGEWGARFHGKPVGDCHMRVKGSLASLAEVWGMGTTFR